MAEILEDKTHEWWAEKSKKWTAGSNLEEAAECVKNFNSNRYRVLINSIGDKATNTEQIEKCRDLYLSLIELINKNGFNAGITVRLTNIGIEYSYEEAKNALKAVLDKAKQNNIGVEVDMEEKTVVENTVKLISEMIEQAYSLRLCIQSGLKDAYKYVDDLLKIAKQNNINLSFRVVTGSCYKETLELTEPETIKQFYKIMSLCGSNSAIGTHIAERLLCAKANNMETQVLMAFEDSQPKGSVDTIYACFGDWKTNKGIRGYILRREG